MNRPTGLQQKLAWSRAFSAAITSYLEAHRVRKLQLGTGINVLDGWFNTDVSPKEGIFFLDSTKPFPFADATFHYIFSEHHIEHLSYDQGLFTLHECYRVLQPGGKIRIATPDLGVLLNLYTASSSDLQQRYIRFIIDNFMPSVHGSNAVFVINNAFHNWGHQFLYDSVTLKAALQEVGFSDIIHSSPGQSDDEQLRGIEKHGEFIDNEEMNQFETQVVEGKHP